MAAARDKEPNGSFIRWQAYSIAQLTIATNLVLTLSLAVLGYLLILMLQPDENLHPGSVFARLGLVASTLLSAVAVALGIWLVLNRMRSFRSTAQAARLREKREPETEIELYRARYKAFDRKTWCLFYSQVWVFAASIVLAFFSIVLPAACRYLSGANG
jgi:hypothetical protein